MSRSSFIENNPEKFASITNSDFLYQQATCGFISFLPDGSILRVNNTLSKWLGMTDEEIYKLKFTSLLTKSGGLYYEMVLNPLLNLRGFANEINFRFKTIDGSFDTLFNAVAFKDESGKVIAINATIQDITDRKKYEAELLLAKRFAEEEKRRFEFLSNTIPNLIWTALPTGEINFVNQRTKDHLNMDLSEIGNLEGIFEKDRKLFAKAWDNCIKTGNTLEMELRIYSSTNELEWFFLYAEPYYNKEGVIELWFGSCTNIHKQKLRDLARYSSLSDSLTMANKTIDGHRERFIQIAMNQSHLIRKPLANIIGLTSLLNDLPLSDEGSHLLKLLNDSTEELDGIIKEVINQTNHLD